MILRHLSLFLFFVLECLYLALFIRPDFLYSAIVMDGRPFPVFETGVPFLLSHLSPPGIVDYIVALLAQTYSSAWLGALTLTILSGTAFLMLRRLFSDRSSLPAIVLGLMPSLVCVLWLSRYVNPLYILVWINMAIMVLTIFLIPLRILTGRRLLIPSSRLASPTRAIAIMTTAAAISCVVMHDSHRRDRLLLEHLDRNDRFDDYIAACGSLDEKNLDSLILFDLNRALFNTRRLGSEMFHYPQRAAFSCALPQSELDFAHDIRFIRFHRELGSINNAQHLLYEHFANTTEHPFLLNLMAECHIVKGETAAAAKIYRRLLRDPVYGGFAASMLQSIETPSPAFTNLSALKRKIPLHNRGMIGLNLRDLCEDMLAADPQNRMAFEYLLTIHLLSRDLTPFARLVGRYREFGYADLPRHWAEAIALYHDLSGSVAFTVGMREEAAGFRKAMLELQRRSRAAGEDEEAFRDRALLELGPEFGSTYYFYYFFNTSGVIRCFD